MIRRILIDRSLHWHAQIGIISALMLAVTVATGATELLFHIRHSYQPGNSTPFINWSHVFWSLGVLAGTIIPLTIALLYSKDLLVRYRPIAAILTGLLFGTYGVYSLLHLNSNTCQKPAPSCNSLPGWPVVSPDSIVYIMGGAGLLLVGYITLALTKNSR